MTRDKQIKSKYEEELEIAMKLGIRGSLGSDDEYYKGMERGYRMGIAFALEKLRAL
jgi:hypothetical protein